VRNSSRVTTEACCPFKRSETVHRRVSLFDPTMVLLQPIVEVFPRSMGNIAAHGLANSSRIGCVPIGCHLLRNMANDRHCLLKKSLSCLPIPFRAQQGSHQIALVVDRSIQIAPLPMGSVRTETTPWTESDFCSPSPGNRCEREAETHELSLLRSIHNQKASPRKQNLATQLSFAQYADVPLMNELALPSTSLKLPQTLSCCSFCGDDAIS
jgi:hypothetical protein